VFPRDIPCIKEMMMMMMIIIIIIIKQSKQSRYRPGVAQRVPGS